MRTLALIVVLVLFPFVAGCAEDDPPPTISAAKPAGPVLECFPLKPLQDALAEQYGMARTGMGVAANGSLIALLHAPSGDWMIAIIPPDPPARACPLADGTGWQRFAVGQGS